MEHRTLEVWEENEVEDGGLPVKPAAWPVPKPARPALLCCALAGRPGLDETSLADETTKEVMSRLELAWDKKNLSDDKLKCFDDPMSLLRSHEDDGLEVSSSLLWVFPPPPSHC